MLRYSSRWPGTGVKGEIALIAAWGARAFAAALAAIGTGACQDRAEPTDMRLTVLAHVDGRQVRASTSWLVTMADTFPQGAAIKVKGVALAIPVAPDRYVYGLLRTVIGDNLYQTDMLAAGLDAVVLDEDGRRGVASGTSRSDLRDNAIGRLRGREVELCLPKGQGLAGQDRCPVFMFFRNAVDPQSVERVVPGVAYTVDGHRVVIDRVTGTFIAPQGRNYEGLAFLPPYIASSTDVVARSTGVKLGKLPAGLMIDGDRQLRTNDFVRYK